jgi:hypothetical protein
MFRLFLEYKILNFTGNTVKSINFGVQIFENAALLQKATRLEEAGVLFVNGVDTKGAKVYAALYDGKVMARANTEIALQEKLGELNLLNKSGSSLIAELKEIAKRIPQLTEDGRFWTCVNKAGTEFRWGNVSHKNVGNNIKQLENSKDTSKQWNGDVAKVLSEVDNIETVNTKIEYYKPLKGKYEPAGDYDVLSSNYLVECKESVSKTVLNDSSLFKQMVKYLDKSNELFVNFNNKTVILAIKSFGEGTGGIDNPVFKELTKVAIRNKMEFFIITNLNQLKNL